MKQSKQRRRKEEKKEGKAKINKYGKILNFE